MRRLILFISLLILNVSSFSQTYKVFYNKNGHITKDSTKAWRTMIATKMDSMWSMSLFNQKGYLMTEGSFLDSSLTVANGIFVQYEIVTDQKSIDKDHSSIDTLMAKTLIGYYVNNSKEGIWRAYYINGKKRFTEAYQNNVLNGGYKEYYDNGNPYVTGNYVDGQKEGEWFVFNADSTIQTQSSYKHGFQYDFKNFNANERYFIAYPGYNFIYYVQKYLRKKNAPAARGQVVIDFIIAADGTITKPVLGIGLDPLLDKLIIEAISESPKWVPARKNGKHVEEKLSVLFSYGPKTD